MTTMNACKHFELFELPTDIVQAENPWNAWVIAYKNGKVYYSTFSAGLYWNFMEHLLNSKKCRKEVGIRKSQVKRILKRVEKAWREAVKDC